MPFKIVMLVPASNISVLEELAGVLIEHPEIAIRIISDEEFSLFHTSSQLTEENNYVDPTRRD